jgi:serine/threonine protein kinase
MESKLIQEGTYGCVVKPPLPCLKTKAVANNVGKIVRKKNTEIELSVATLVKGIDGWEKYYVIQNEDSCTTQNFTRLRPVHANQCRVYTESENSELIQLLSPFAGTPVYKMDVSDIHYISALKHVLTAVAKLSKQGICHFDLHENNVLVNKGILRIIDFGSAFLGDETTDKVVQRHIYDFSPRFPPQPPELSVQNALYAGLDIKLATEQTVKQKHVYSVAYKLLGMNPATSLKDIKEFWSYEPYNGGSWVPFFKAHWRSWDSWAVGVMFLNILEKSFLKPTFINTIWKNHSGVIRTVLKGLLQSDPTKRMTAAEALELL